MTTAEFRLSDLDLLEIERVAGECDVAAADCARRGQYDRADDLKTAALIVRQYASLAETVQVTAPVQHAVPKTGFGNL